MPPELVYPARACAGQTLAMAKRKRSPAARSKPRAPRAARPGAEVRAPLDVRPGPSGQELLLSQDPLHGTTPDRRLIQALELVGIDHRVAAQPSPIWLEAWRHGVRVRGEHAELVALAVAHAEDARACSRGDIAGEVLSQEVICTAHLLRNRKPPEGLEDERLVLTMDGEVIALLRPQDDSRSALVTVKLPQVVIDRLRDAVHAMAPARTMAGITALGITLVLDQLEAAHIKHTGHGFPRRGGAVLEGGRPSRTRATTAAPARRRKRPQKPGKSNQ